MTEVRNPAGRLITFRVRPPVDDGNAGHAATELRGLIQALAERAVVCVDLTEARTFSPETAQRFIALMKADNPKIERSGFLLPDNAATFVLQVERMIREAANPARRTFRQPGELRDWLRPELSDAEQLALDGFLSDIGTTPPAA